MHLCAWGGGRERSSYEILGFQDKFNRKGASLQTNYLQTIVFYSRGGVGGGVQANFHQIIFLTASLVGSHGHKGCV